MTTCPVCEQPFRVPERIAGIFRWEKVEGGLSSAWTRSRVPAHVDCAVKDMRRVDLGLVVTERLPTGLPMKFEVLPSPTS